MADLFSMTTPLMIRSPHGEEQVIAEIFPHPEGLVYFDLYWHLGQPEETIHLVKGTVRGEGPWRIGEHVINVLGCHGTNAQLRRNISNGRLICKQKRMIIRRYR